MCHSTNKYVIPMLVAIIIVLFVIIITITVKMCSSESFVNRSEGGYYWNTDNATFVSKTDKDVAINYLLDKLRVLGINNITKDQLMALQDSALLNILDLNLSGDVDEQDVAMLRLYIDPQYYVASTYVNQATTSNRQFSGLAQRKLIYDVIKKYYTMSKIPKDMPSLESISDSDLINEFEVVRSHKNETDGASGPDMAKISDESQLYRTGKRILPKMQISSNTVFSTESSPTNIATPVASPTQAITIPIASPTTAVPLSTQA